MDDIISVTLTSLIVILLISLIIATIVNPCIFYHNLIENKYCPRCGEYINKIPSCECGKEYVAAYQEYCTACGKEKK